MDRDARFMMDRAREPERSSGSRVAKFAAPPPSWSPCLPLDMSPFVLLARHQRTAHRGESYTSSADASGSAGASGHAVPINRAPACGRSDQGTRGCARCGGDSGRAVPINCASACGGSDQGARDAARCTGGIAAAGAMDDARAEQKPSGIASAPNPLPPNPLPPKPLVAKPSPPAQTESLLARESKQPATAGTAPAQEVPRLQPTAKISEPQPGGTARIIIAVAPQGELYINGKHYGTTPPLTTLELLEPGMHRIEIRSGSRKPYLTYMTVEAGDLRRIRYDSAQRPVHLPESHD